MMNMKQKPQKEFYARHFFNLKPSYAIDKKN